MLLLSSHFGTIPRDGSSSGNAAARLFYAEVSKVYGGQHRPEPTAQERGARAEEKEAWERMANGWYENAWILLKAPSTLERSSQGKDPRTFRDPVERW